MARIYMEYTKNAFVEHPDYFMLALFIIISFVMISIGDVLTNIPKNNFPSAFTFFVSALKGTSWIIQALIAGFFIRVIVSGIKVVHKNIGDRLSIAKFKY
jgi:hypothetical protein